MADLAPMNRHRPKFTLDELELLVNQMQRNKSTLLCKFSDVQAAQTKNDAWRAISAMIIAVAKLGSTTDEMRRKWLDQGKRLKTKGVFSPEVDEKKTGCKKDDIAVVSSVEERVIAVLGS